MTNNSRAGDLSAIIDLIIASDFTEVRVSVDGVDLAMSRLPEGLGGWGRGPQPTESTVPSQRSESSLAVAHSYSGAEPAARPSADVATDVATVIPDGTVVVEAAMLGTFYRSPRPGEPPFVDIGSEVTEGTRMAIVEAMKLMNEIHAGVSGVVEAILVADGELVEYGQPLFAVRPV